MLSFIRAMGNSFLPLIFLAGASVLNIVLDIWFVVGLNLGVSGAALATVIAQAVSGLGLLVYSPIKLSVLKSHNERISLNSHRLKEIIVNDVATGTQQSVMNFGILMIQGLVNSFGTTVMASFAAAVKIDTIAYMPVQEFGNAYSLFVSQNYGAGRKKQGVILMKQTNVKWPVLISAYMVVKGIINLILGFSAGNVVTLIVSAVLAFLVIKDVPYMNYIVGAYLAVICIIHLIPNITGQHWFYLAEGILDLIAAFVLFTSKRAQE